MPLPPEKTKAIEDLLKEGEVSKREISRRLVVSRVTIDRIEKKLLFPEEDKPPQIRVMHFTSGDDRLSEENKPEYERCPGCRGLQQKGVKCLVCQIRKWQMQEYDCYIKELLTPQIVYSPLSSNHKLKGTSSAKKGRKKRKG